MITIFYICPHYALNIFQKIQYTTIKLDDAIFNFVLITLVQKK